MKIQIHYNFLYPLPKPAGHPPPTDENTFFFWKKGFFFLKDPGPGRGVNTLPLLAAKASSLPSLKIKWNNEFGKKCIKKINFISIICNEIKTIIYYLGCSGSSWTPGFWSSILLAMDMIRPWISIKFEALFTQLRLNLQKCLYQNLISILFSHFNGIPIISYNDNYKDLF